MFNPKYLKPNKISIVPKSLAITFLFPAKWLYRNLGIHYDWISTQYICFIINSFFPLLIEASIEENVLLLFHLIAQEISIYIYIYIIIWMMKKRTSMCMHEYVYICVGVYIKNSIDTTLFTRYFTIARLRSY